MHDVIQLEKVSAHYFKTILINVATIIKMLVLTFQIASIMQTPIKWIEIIKFMIQ